MENKIEEGLQEVIDNQGTAQQGLQEVIDNQGTAQVFADKRHKDSEDNNESRHVIASQNDCNRETRWKTRYWSAAVLGVACVIGATWYLTNYVTHFHGTVLYNDAQSTSGLMEAKRELIEVRDDLMERNENLLDSVLKQEVLITDLSNMIEEKTIKQVWFDHKREHTNAGFAKVDDKYPAGYEVWDGEKLIERWHWRIDGQPKTEQFGEYITRCVAIYDDKGEYSGFTQTVMSHFPNDRSGDLGFFKNNRKEDSIKFTFNTKQSSFELISDDMGILWEKGELKYSYLVHSDFKHSWSVNGTKGGTTRELHEVIKTLEHYKYLVHVSKMFGFIDKKIIKPFDEINPEFAVRLEVEKSNQQVALSYREKYEIAQSKLNCSLAFIHDDPFFWKKVNPNHLNENWEVEFKYWISISPRMELHLIDQSHKAAKLLLEDQK
jgi:hypothetical protein